MNILYLPGSSSSNRAWINSIESSLGKYFERNEVVEYSHWNSTEGTLDFEIEVEKIRDLNLGEDLVVFAKSAGVILCCYAYYRGVISPSRCIFVGSAVNYGKRIFPNLEEMFQTFNVPALFIHKTKDPAIFVSNLNRYLESFYGGEYYVHELEGESHQYFNIRKLVDLSVKFLGVGN